MEQKCEIVPFSFSTSFNPLTSKVNNNTYIKFAFQTKLKCQFSFFLLYSNYSLPFLHFCNYKTEEYTCYIIINDANIDEGIPIILFNNNKPIQTFYPLAKKITISYSAINTEIYIVDCNYMIIFEFCIVENQWNKYIKSKRYLRFKKRNSNEFVFFKGEKDDINHSLKFKVPLLIIIENEIEYEERVCIINDKNEIELTFDYKEYINKDKFDKYENNNNINEYNEQIKIKTNETNNYSRNKSFIYNSPDYKEPKTHKENHLNNKRINKKFSSSSRRLKEVDKLQSKTNKSYYSLNNNSFENRINPQNARAENYTRKTFLTMSPFLTNSSFAINKTKQLFFPEVNSLTYNKYFYFLEANSYAVITLDFRHISDYEEDFIYEYDWDMTFEKYPIYTNLESDTLNPSYLQLPDTFISGTNPKAKVHQFTLYTYEDIYISINFNLYSDIFSSYFSMFNTCATIQQIRPNRASLHTNKIFGIVLTRDDTFNLPVNILLINNSLESQYDTIKDKIQKNFVGYSSSLLSMRNPIKNGINYYDSANAYWGASTVLGMTFLPYFSNCKGFGRYVPLWVLLEQNEKCDLIEENNTIYISDFSFGTNAKGDTCNIELECLYDEDPTKLSNKHYWFQAKTGDILFAVTKNPISLEELIYHPEELETVPVIVSNQCSLKDEIPSVIEININYFQKDKKTKHIIDITLVLKMEKDNNFQAYTPAGYAYKLKVNYFPYSHTKLMVAFALSAKFYLVLYLIEGVISVIMVFTFYLYHRCMSRRQKGTKFKYFSFFPLVIPPAFFGFIIAFSSIFVIYYLVGIITIGKYIFINFHLFSYITSSGVEYFSPFDFLSYFSDSTIDITKLRKGRLGTALFFIGVAFLYHYTNLVVPSNEKLSHNKTYDKNKWDFFRWKKLNVYFFYLILTLINLCYTMLSFVNVWSRNIWVFIYSYKILGIIIENYFEEVFKEQLLISGIPCIFNLVQSLLTFGASSLIDFLKSSFIEQGGALIEKIYLESFTNYLKEHANEYSTKIKNFIRKVLKYDLELESEKKVKENNEEENDDAIILTDEDEKEIFKEGNDENRKNNYNRKEALGEKRGFNSTKYHFEFKSSEESESDNISIDNPNTVIIEEFFDRYKGFASDLLSYFYNIVFYLFLWCFYDETHILEYYEIKKENFIYFYFFTIFSVVFLISNDIIMHNLMEEYSNIPMHDFLDYVQYRFYIRETSWALDDNTNVNFSIDFSVRKMYKLCFSSQYFYLKTLYISGLISILIGITTLLLNNINPLGDSATLFILFTVITIMKIVQIIFTAIGKFFKLWEVEPFEEQEDKINEDVVKKAKNVHKNSNNNNTDIKKFILPIKINNWEKVKYLKEQEAIIEENLKTERLELDTIRKQFVNLNKKWLQDIICDIITPRTLIANKNDIIKVLQKRYHIKEPNIDLHSIRFYSPPQSNNNSYRKGFKDYSFYKQNLQKELMKEILTIWRRKAKLLIQLKHMTKFIILDLKGKKCYKCEGNLSLVSIFIGNYLQYFFEYLDQAKEDINTFNTIGFKIYFKKNAKKDTITLCSNCIN